MTNTAPSAWNPGLNSKLPDRYRALETIYRPENTFTDVAQVREIAGMTGLPPEEIVTFRPERLALHEVMIRVMTELSIDQGEKYEVLGLNFRKTAGTILDGYITPHMPEITQRYNQTRGTMLGIINEALNAWLAPATPPIPEAKGFLKSLFGQKAPNVTAPFESSMERDLRIIRLCEARVKDNAGSEELAAFYMLARVMGKVCGQGGSLSQNRAAIARIATDMACNAYGSIVIGTMIKPWFEAAIEDQGYRRLPLQDHPVIMSVKGASASGKSTQRKPLRALSAELGLDWGEFALISPDIFRKFLLDYDTLGDAYLYAGTLTGHELSIIDHKLDERLAGIAISHGRTSHMLIDRFREDTFSAQNTSGPYVSRADKMYMFFMITPPDQIVERGWLRGLEVGRYKAVEDFLAHSVEAYEGMQQLLFKWAGSEKPDYHFELVDNSVPKGARALTAAYGFDHRMIVFDPALLVDVQRYTHLNVQAKSPEEVYPKGAIMDARHNMEFWDACLDKMQNIQFIDRESRIVYASYFEQTLHIHDDGLYDAKLTETDHRAIFEHIGARVAHSPVYDHPRRPEHLNRRDVHVLGMK